MTVPPAGYDELPPPPTAAPPHPPRRDDNDTVATLTNQLAEQLARLAHDEFALAQLEIKQRAKKASVGAGILGLSAAFAFFGACCGIAAAVLGLANVMRPWAAAIAVTLIFLVLATVLALAARRVFTAGRAEVPTTIVDRVKADLSAVRTAIADE